MWVTKLLISQVKKRIFCPKLAFLVNFGQAMQAYSVPCWWVGWWLWRAGCISQDTYLLYINSLRDESQITLQGMYSRAKRVQWLHFLQGGQSNLLEMVKICRGVDGNLRVCAIKCTHTHTHRHRHTDTHTGAN